MSKLRDEIAEIPARVADALDQAAGAASALSESLLQLRPKMVFTVAHGSSGAVAAYARALISRNLGLPAAGIPPASPAFFGARMFFPPSWLFAISQSGRSPDILDTVGAFNNTGTGPRFSIALVNDTEAPLAELTDLTVDQSAGVEQSVAATKSVICSMAAMARMIGELTADEALLSGLTALPTTLEAALSQRADLNGLAATGPTGLFVLGRSFSHPVAAEAALKLKETCLLPSEAVDGAEVMHGPKALVEPGFPILAFPPVGDAAEGFTKTIEHLAGLGAAITQIDPSPGQHEVIAPIEQLTRFYAALPYLADQLGLDPDTARNLTKVTKT
ncbi:MAG: SIS domain-containing protein [Pseudomonadota bacterium]